MRMTEAKKSKGVNTQAMLRAQYGFKKPKDEIDQAIQAFLTGASEGQFGRYAIHGNMLLYKAVISEKVNVFGWYSGVENGANAQMIENVKELIADSASLRIELVSHSVEQLSKHLKALESNDPEQRDSRERIRQVTYKVVKANLIAKRVNEATYIGNSSVLGLIGRTVAFGNQKLNRGETEVQRRLSTLIPMIPFTVFAEAGLDLDQYTLVDRGSEEQVTRLRDKYNSRTKKTDKVPETVHFTGASLFRVGSATFLFDIDRREIGEGVFNPFLAEIPGSPKTIAEAYEALKPAEVKAAEAAGLKVLRQGEWFFIPVKGKYEADRNQRFDSSEPENDTFNRRYVTGVLQAGENRPNDVSLFNSEHNLFSGVVTHRGREHAPLQLKGWYRAVPNTATKSFTITGDVD